MKKCKKCNEEKPLNEFYNNSSCKDGKANVCKVCRKKQKKIHYKKNIEKYKKRGLEYYYANREKHLHRMKEYREVEEHKIYMKKYLKEYMKNYILSNEQKEKYKKRKKCNPISKVEGRLRWQVRRLRNYTNKSNIDLIGCSAEMFYKMHGNPDLENLHIDHIVPLSWFDLENPNHLKVCCNYNNLQFLQKEDNLKKSNKYAGSPANIIGLKEDFNIENYVNGLLKKI